MCMEKPFCRTLEEADEIVRACEMRHIKLALAHISRYSPVLATVKKLIAAGEIGHMLEIRTRGKKTIAAARKICGCSARTCST